MVSLSDQAPVMAGTFLSGAMLSLSLVAVPVLLDTTKEPHHLFTQWATMYNYGHKVMPAIAIGTFSLYSYACYKRRAQNKPWGVFALAAVITMVMLPFTWFMMAPTNNELFRLEEASEFEPLILAVPAAKKLVMRWSGLHVVRSMWPLTGAALGLAGMHN